MPRQARIDAPGALHHIIVRGIEQSKIFRDDQDRLDFVERLGDILPDTKTSCYAWSLMPNHVHLLLRTGIVPVATVMRRLLTGYAVTFNRRYRRHGQLFQNRYKSILCQEEPYLLELVRYIHLNPLRSKLIEDLAELDVYPFTGHSFIYGKKKNRWQDTKYVLSHFADKVALARKSYRAYVKEGIGQGRRPELVGGGLIRSLGGWSKVKDLRKTELRVKGDERILGDSDFVLNVLEFCEEQLERRYKVQAEGFDLDQIAQKAASLCGIKSKEIFAPVKYPVVVRARSLFCFWAVRELGVSATALARTLKISQPAVSISVRRGEKLAIEKGFQLLEE